MSCNSTLVGFFSDEPRKKSPADKVWIDSLGLLITAQVCRVGQLPNYCYQSLQVGYPKTQMRKAWEKLHSRTNDSELALPLPAPTLGAIPALRGTRSAPFRARVNCAVNLIMLECAPFVMARKDNLK